MIDNRPKYLLDDPHYRIIPPLPLKVNHRTLPPLMRRSLVEVGGIQPITEETCAAAGGPLLDKPSPGEIDYHRRIGNAFQMVSIVLSLVPEGPFNKGVPARPFAVSLIPGSKRGKIDERTIDFVAAIDVDGWLRTEPTYLGFDPFKGTYSIYGALNIFLDQSPKDGFLDEIGLVVGQYFLATRFDREKILTSPVGLTSADAERRYQRHRQRILFTPFQRIETRRVWGAQSAIELFMIQALAQCGLTPDIQMLIFDDGSTFPSLYHLWSDVEFRHSDDLVTEADLYFPDERVAIFCDSHRHHRGAKRKQNDEAIDLRLSAVGIRSVRIPGKLIVSDLKAATDMVIKSLSKVA